jgi:hypothetical protein
LAEKMALFLPTMLLRMYIFSEDKMACFLRTTKGRQHFGSKLPIFHPNFRRN